MTTVRLTNSGWEEEARHLANIAMLFLSSGRSPLNTTTLDRAETDESYAARPLLRGLI